MPWKKKNKKSKNRPAEPETCKLQHFDTEEKADLIMAVIIRSGKKPVKQYSHKCQAWHVGAVA